MSGEDRSKGRDRDQDLVSGYATLALGLDNIASLEELFGEELGNALMATAVDRMRTRVPHVAALHETRHRRIILHLPGFDVRGVTALVTDLQALVAADAVDTPFGPVATSLSAGCVFVPRGAQGQRDDADVLPALHALHTAMANGPGSLEFARDDAKLLDYRTELMVASRAAVGAIGSENLTIAFQPIVRATGSNTISFHEVLVRIRQRDGSLLSAAAFIPAIERLGLAPLIDRQVLAMTFETMQAHPTTRLSINIFPQTMQDQHWLAMFEEATAENPTLAERLIIEVTEASAMLDPGRTLMFMDRMRQYGVSFAIDDFGSGQTSFRYLRDFHFDMIKIDGHFVKGVTDGSDSAFFIESLVNIAHRFDMMTVAEYVQGPAEARCLTRLGVEYFQGFHFGSPSLMLEPTSRPMPDIAAQA